MKQLVRGKHRHLLEDERVKRWYDNLCRGSKVTADVYMRRLGLICSLRGTSPSELVTRPSEIPREPEPWQNFFKILPRRENPTIRKPYP